MRCYTTLILALCLSTGWAAPERSSRIVGGDVTTIDNYPYTASLMKFINIWFQSCAGTILTSTAIVSAARCFGEDPPSVWRARVGSNYAHSGGVLHDIRLITNHPRWGTDGLAFNVAILRTATSMLYSNFVQPARVAGPNYILPDGSSVIAVGWGAIAEAEESSEQLKHVEVWTVNQEVCRVRYVEWAHNAVWFAVPELKADMVCAGHLDVGGRGTCQGDYGGPLLHDGDVLYGITSWSETCGVASLPEIYTRVSDYTAWIVETAVA